VCMCVCVRVRGVTLNKKNFLIMVVMFLTIVVNKCADGKVMLKM